MKIIVNGNEHIANDEDTVASLLQQLQIPLQSVAVERNKSIVPKSEFSTTLLQPDDSLEIVTFVGGG